MVILSLIVRLQNTLLVSTLTIILLVGHCNSTPLKPTLHSRKPSSRHATAFALQRRARFFRTQYRVVQHTLGAMIVASPLIRVVPGIAELYGTGGHDARMYRQIIDDFTERWLQLGGQPQYHIDTGALQIEMFSLPFENQQPIPLGFIQRFYSIMELWAVNGYMSLYDVVLENVSTLQQIGVRMKINY